MVLSNGMPKNVSAKPPPSVKPGNGELRPASVQRFALLVKKARERKCWSQATLAETAHVDKDVIYRLEAGKADPPFSLVADLTRILNLDLPNAVFNQRVAKQVSSDQTEETTV